MITHKDRIVVLSFLASSNQSMAAAVATSPSGSSGEDLSAHVGGGPRRPINSLEDAGSRSLEDLAPISPEFINYAVALLVYSVRYPAVFWETNKPFSFLFSLQLVLSSLQTLMAFAGFAVLYKLNAYGVELVLPTVEHFLLGRAAAMLLFLLSCTIVGLSGAIVYFYGLRKFQASVGREREKHHISWRESSRTLWGYLPHCLAFASLLAMACVTCPLMYDYTVVYKGSLDGAVLSCVVATIMYFFLWIVLWFVLTLKQRWRFRCVQPTGGIAAAALCNGKATAIELLQRHHSKHSKLAPLIVISNGQTYTVKDMTPKKAIMSVVHRSAAARHKNSGDEDDVYWLKPKAASTTSSSCPMPSPDAWSSTKKKASPTIRHKVTFEDTIMGGSPKKVRAGAAGGAGKSPKMGSKLKKQSVKFEDLTDTDEDGDYATLRDLPHLRKGDELHEEQLEELLREHAYEEECEYKDSIDRGHDKAFSPIPDPEHVCLLVKSPVHQINVAVTVHDESPSPQMPLVSDVLQAMKTTSTDEEHHDGVATTRSNSLSSSCSPPEKGSSDTSSGVHSSSSICDNSARKSSSMDDLVRALVGRGGGDSGEPGGDGVRFPQPDTCWKSLSLQRTPYGHFHHPSSVLGTLPAHDYMGGGGTALSPGAMPDAAGHETMVMFRNRAAAAAAAAAAEAPRGQESFGRATNMRLTSFADPGAVVPPTSTASVAANKQPCKIAPLTIGVLTSSPRHLPSTSDPHATSRTALPHIQSLVAAVKSPIHQRDSANYSLTSSGDSDNCLSHT